MSKKQRGSKILTFIIIAIFIVAGMFYLITSHPDIIKKTKAYFKRDNSLGALSHDVYDNVVYPAESGAFADFDYLSDYDTQKTVLPLKNAVITSHFGSRTDPVTGKLSASHHGIDLASGAGSEVVCFCDGVVSGVEYDDPVYGCCVTVTHNGIQSFYAHLSEISVTSGEKLQAGDRIGIIGSTGKSTGIHLHFELLRDGVSFDPYSYLYEKV